MCVFVCVMQAMLDGYVRKVTLERRTNVFEKATAEMERRKRFEIMVGGCLLLPSYLFFFFFFSHSR